VGHGVQGFVGGTVSYVGKRYEGFPPDLGQPQPLIPAYTYANLNTGFTTDGYTVTAFVKNITNKYGILSTQTEFAAATSGVLHTAIITPRTVGISVSKSF
jgi:iron complex outermembrane receptor protein